MKQEQTEKNGAGFSLVEITITIGIVALVLLPLLGILSQGSITVAESEDRFAATRIVQSIESEMKFSPEENAFFLGSVVDPSNGNFTDITMPGTGGTSSAILAFDRKAQLVREATDGDYLTGTDPGDSDILYLVKVTLSATGSNSGAGTPALLEMDFSVEQPAFATEQNRTKEKLRTLVSAQ